MCVLDIISAMRGKYAISFICFAIKVLFFSGFYHPSVMIHVTYHDNYIRAKMSFQYSDDVTQVAMVARVDDCQYHTRPKIQYVFSIIALHDCFANAIVV